MWLAQLFRDDCFQWIAKCILPQNSVLSILQLLHSSSCAAHCDAALICLFFISASLQFNEYNAQR